jgi:hypothetical protein
LTELDSRVFISSFDEGGIAEISKLSAGIED